MATTRLKRSAIITTVDGVTHHLNDYDVQKLEETGEFKSVPHKGLLFGELYKYKGVEIKDYRFE